MPCANRPMTIGLLNACTRSCCSTLTERAGGQSDSHVHTNTLKRWVQAFAAEGEDALLRMGWHPNGWLTTDEQQQFTTWSMPMSVPLQKPAPGCSNSSARTTRTVGCASCSNGSTIASNSQRSFPQKRIRKHKPRGLRPTRKGGLTRRGRVYFLDAAHLLHAAVPSQGWIKRNHTMQLRTNSGRNRLNVLGAYSPDDQSLISRRPGVV